MNGRVDKAWFDWLISRSPYGTYEEIAKRMRNSKGNPLDKGGLSRRISGEYAFTDPEIDQFARLIDADLIECRRRARMWVPGMDRIAI